MGRLPRSCGGDRWEGAADEGRWWGDREKGAGIEEASRFQKYRHRRELPLPACPTALARASTGGGGYARLPEKGCVVTGEVESSEAARLLALTSGERGHAATGATPARGEELGN